MFQLKQAKALRLLLNFEKMKILQINWQTGEILEKGVLSNEHTIDVYIETYKKINAELARLGINKVWLIAP